LEVPETKYNCKQKRAEVISLY